MNESVRVTGRSFSITQLSDGSGFCVIAGDGRIEADQAWSKRQAAEYLQCSETTISRYMKLSDPLPHSKATGSPMFFKSDIDAWLRRQMVARPSKKTENLL
jgi:predicted DNA-binding transcriptional regulator AlpA